MKHRLIPFLVIAFGCASAAAAQTAPAPAPAPMGPVLTGPIARPSGVTTPRVITPFPSGAFASSRYYSEIYGQVLQYGECAANVSPTRAVRFLDAAPNTPTERVTGTQLQGISRGCLPYGYSAPVIFLRAAVSEALYKRHAGDAVPRAISDANLARFIAEESQRDRTRLADDRMFVRVAACMTSTAPDAVHRMLLTTPGAPEERAALERIAARTRGCVASGRRLDANSGTTFIRAYLAEAAYRLTASDHG